jgi:hypothetical protein
MDSQVGCLPGCITAGNNALGHGDFEGEAGFSLAFEGGHDLLGEGLNGVYVEGSAHGEINLLSTGFDEFTYLVDRLIGSAKNLAMIARVFGTPG